MKIDFLYKVPEEIKEEFYRESEDNGWRVMTLICRCMMFVQLFNICNVLFISSKKLGTLNNRIYFTFYCVLLAAGLLFLAVHRYLPLKKGGRMAKRIQTAFSVVWVLWGFSLNYYELFNFSKGDLSIAITAVLGTSICMQYTPVQAAVILGGGSFVFAAAAAPLGGLGTVLNILIAAGMGMLASYTGFRYKINDIQNRKTIEDMNKKLEAEGERLHLSFQKLSIAIEQMDNIMFDWDIKTGKILFSEKWERDFGYSREVKDIPRWFSRISFLTYDEKSKLIRGIKQAVRNKEVYETELLIQNEKGKSGWYLLRFLPQYKSDGSIRYGIGFLTGIQRQKEEICAMQAEMSQDSLTGILNRRGIQQVAENELEKCAEEDAGEGTEEGRCCILLIDLDEFKQVNDTYGHPCGDKVLVRVAAVLEKHFADWGSVGRIGGDEFMVVCGRTISPKAFMKQVSRLPEIPITVFWENMPIKVRLSIGGAVSAREDTYGSLYQKADEALYKAKEEGKGRYYFAKEHT